MKIAGAWMMAVMVIVNSSLLGGCAVNRVGIDLKKISVISPTFDDDDDGIRNDMDQCQGSQRGQTIGPDGCVLMITEPMSSINFDVDSAVLRADAWLGLNEYAAILKQRLELRVEIAGHSDSCGDEEANFRLSEKRARAAAEHLLGQGVQKQQIIRVKGYGESRPHEDVGQNSPQCRSEANRRVEILAQ